MEPSFSHSTSLFAVNTSMVAGNLPNFPRVPILLQEKGSNMTSFDK